MTALENAHGASTSVPAPLVGHLADPDDHPERKIALRDVSFYYADNKALKNVTVDLYDRRTPLNRQHGGNLGKLFPHLHGTMSAGHPLDRERFDFHDNTSNGRMNVTDDNTNLRRNRPAVITRSGKRCAGEGRRLDGRKVDVLPYGGTYGGGCL